MSEQQIIQDSSTEQQKVFHDKQFEVLLTEILKEQKETNRMLKEILHKRRQQAANE